MNSLYGATFDNRSDVVTAMAASMTSFSTHAADGDFEREHGVWSQWRDYAGPDGFCIVLETAALGRLLAEDMDSRYCAHLKLDPVAEERKCVLWDAWAPSTFTYSPAGRTRVVLACSTCLTFPRSCAALNGDCPRV